MIKRVRDSTISEHDKVKKMMDYEAKITSKKFLIAVNEDHIIKHEQALGDRGVSSIIRQGFIQDFQFGGGGRCCVWVNWDGRVLFPGHAQKWC